MLEACQQQSVVQLALVCMPTMAKVNLPSSDGDSSERGDPNIVIKVINHLALNGLPSPPL